jgi:hypothetical protein
MSAIEATLGHDYAILMELILLLKTFTKEEINDYTNVSQGKEKPYEMLTESEKNVRDSWTYKMTPKLELKTYLKLADREPTTY